MRIALWCAMSLAIATYAAPRSEVNDDDDCVQGWITVGEDPSSTLEAFDATPSASIAANEAIKSIDATSTSPTSSATKAHFISVPSASSSRSGSPGSSAGSAENSGLSMPDLPYGTPTFPLNSDHLKAPVADDPVPEGAAVFIPEDGKIFNCSAFAD